MSLNKRGVRLSLFLLSFLLFSAVLASGCFAVSIEKEIAGTEPHPVNKTMHTSINVTNTDQQNITSFVVIDTYDNSKMSLWYSVPSYNSQDGGKITWNRSIVLEENESDTIDVYWFAPIGQGVTYNNASVNATLLNGTNITGYDIIWFAIGDEYEDDGTYQKATAIPTDGTKQFHTFYNTSTGAADADWVKFNAAAGYYYVIETMNYTEANITDTELRLYYTDGTSLLAYNDDVQSMVKRFSKIVWQAYISGTYYIKVNELYGKTGGNYSISVEQQGHLMPYLVYPADDINITQYSMFNATARLECSGGPCHNVSFTLDPNHKEIKKFDKNEIESVLAEKGVVDIIVKLKDKAAKQGFRALSEEAVKDRKKEIRENQQRFLSSAKKFRLKRAFTTVFNGVSGSVDREGLDELLENEDVEAVYYDRPVAVFLSASVPHINATAVWQEQINGTNITGEGQAVCVIDTGINYNHSDFGGAQGFPNQKVVGGYDFVNSDADPWDDHGHGSHCAGIVASEDSLYKGVAPGARIVAIKALDNNGSGSSADIIAGIDWCVANRTEYNISVISMSIGSKTFGPNLPCDYDAIAPSINAAVEAGIAVVAASGNEARGSTYVPGIASPACISSAISVGATGRNTDTITSYANRDWFLDVLAPGGEGISMIIATDYVGTHIGKIGTSMSTPHAAGVAALMQQQSMLEFGRLTTPQDIRNRLRISGVPVFDSYTGYTFPRIDAYGAVMQKGVIPNITGALPFFTNTSNPYSCGHLADGENCTITWWVNATGTGPKWEFFVIGESDVELNTSVSVYANIQQVPACNISFNPPSPSVYGTAVNASCYCTTPETSPSLWRNGTDVTAEELNKNTVLAAGTWEYVCNVSETQNYTAASASGNYTITKADTTINLTASPNWNVDYPTQTTVNCSASHSQAAISLTRNGNPVSIPDVQTLGAGSYLYNCSMAESQNYTSASESNSLAVKDTTPPNWTGNRTNPASGSAYAQGQSYQFNITWDDDVQVDKVIIEHNFTGTLGNYTVNANLSSEYYYGYTDLAAGAYAWREYANDTTDNWNYTGQWAFVVSKADSEVNLLLNGTDNDFTAERTSTVNITGQLIAGQSVIQLFENGSVIGSNTANFSILRQYNSVGDYNITVYHPGTQNYTPSSESHILTINDTIPPEIAITKPANNSIINNSYQIEVNASTDETAACYYSINSGSYASLGSGALFLSSFSIFENGNYNITINCTDPYSNSRLAASYFAVNDSTAPNITSTSPTGTTTDTTPDLTVNTDEPAICYYTDSANITETENMTNFTITNGTTSTSTLSLSVGSYTYYVKCTDRLNNTMAAAENVSFAITSPPSGGGGGGGGGCRDECSSGEVKCSDYLALAVCEYHVRYGCWQWTEYLCGDKKECENGKCIEVICTENWICDEWAQCINGTQTRECADWNSCGTESIMPPVIRDCLPEEEPEPVVEQPAPVVLAPREPGTNIGDITLKDGVEWKWDGTSWVMKGASGYEEIGVAAKTQHVGEALRGIAAKCGLYSAAAVLVLAIVISLAFAAKKRKKQKKGKKHRHFFKKVFFKGEKLEKIGEDIEKIGEEIKKM